VSKTKEERAEYNRQYYLRNKEERAEKQKRYYLENKEKISARAREYQKKNKEKIREKTKIWYLKNHEREKTKNREAAKKARKEIIAHMGGCCTKCGFDDWRALQADHVNDDGAQDRKKRGHTPHALLRDIKQHKDKYQLLCANCNWIKRYENREDFWNEKQS